MNKPQAYLLKTEWGGYPKGTTVYACAKYDYGLARDDTNATGVEHISVTVDEEGGYPYFTIEKHNLIHLPSAEEDAEIQKGIDADPDNPEWTDEDFAKAEKRRGKGGWPV